MRGRILRGVGGFYYVETERGEIYACRARGGFRRDSIRPLPGDMAEFAVTHEEDREGSLMTILPRKNAMIRPAVANVDQALLFFAVRDPAPSLLMLDRYLLFLRRNHLPGVICFNKTDIAGPGEIEALRDAYRSCGHPLHFVSLAGEEGIGGLAERLAGRITCLAGPSGAGKSTLINRLCPEASMETGELSRKLARGKNTTRHSELFRVGLFADTWLVDTPGFTAFAVPEADWEELEGSYEEFGAFRGLCRFSSCRHLREPDCAVREAVATGRVSALRYGNYQRLMREWEEQQASRYARQNH